MQSAAHMESLFSLLASTAGQGLVSLPVILVVLFGIVASLIKPRKRMDTRRETRAPRGAWPLRWYEHRDW
jgi:hypothetical protein